MTIVKIDGPIASSIKSKRPISKKTGSFDFSVEDSADFPQSQAVQMSISTQGIDALFMAISQKSPNDEQAINQGEQLLKYLDALRLGLIEGRLPKETLHHLENLSESISLESVDGRLQAIVLEIQTRVQVELAKLS